MLDKEFKYFLDHQDELLTKYEGRYIVIKDQKVIGSYESELEAYTETRKKHKLGTFLIQHCIPGKAAYTQTFHSRVYVARV
ncbi:MAG: hypothetical protein FJ217_11405 [Ignavibacteria bacterium]|nr:hypothetical protein [Ignavibacteria bacterium]